MALTLALSLAFPALFAGCCIGRRQRAGQRSEAQAAQGMDQTFRLATEMTDEGMYAARPVLSPSGQAVDWVFADCNERGATFFGLRKQELIGKPVSSIYPAPLLQDFLQGCARAISDGQYEDQHEEPDGSPLGVRWMRRRFVRSQERLAISFKDISDARTHAMQMSRLEHQDAITGLPNRKWLAEFLPVALHQAKDKLALLFVDLDNFKNINDSLGHAIGDLLLRAVATRLQSVTGAHGRVVRLGGDEFAIVLMEPAGRAEAAEIAGLVLEILRFPLQTARGRESMTTSIGISVYPDDAVDVDALLKNAEIAMYSAKGNGKARHHFYDPTLHQELKNRLSLEYELAEAIEKDQFVLFYEPRMEVATGRICGLEALVRWIHPERGMVPPLEFIPLAESTGLILKLGELIIDKACRQIASWRNSGFPVLPVSINISAHQFNSVDISKTFMEALQKYRMPPRLIEIELTESAMLGDEATIRKELASLRALGIRLLLDDFGTGYSSLSQLRRLKMDTLKIDRAFLDALGRTADGEVFIRAIISLAHALGMSVVAEGVERAAQLEALRSLRCDEIQGYYLSKPIAAHLVPQYLAKHDLAVMDSLAAVS